MQEEIEKLETVETEQSKRHYEKPAVAAVRLFADQILLDCSAVRLEFCGTQEPNFSS